MNIKSLNSTTRFSDRVDNYIKYRPSYPREVVDYMIDTFNLSKDWIIADIASGTGIFSKILLNNRNHVYGVEPNKEMREASEKLLMDYDKFVSIDGTAEESTLEERSIDLITAAQAFHWFDPVKAKKEFKRILKKDGIVLFIWNDRQIETSGFLQGYEELVIKYGTDYQKINHRNVRENKSVESFFDKDYTIYQMNNYQEFDFDGLKGRLLSSSYAPNIDHDNYAPMLNTLNDLFEKYKKNKVVRIDYLTQIFWGRLS